MKRVMLSLDRNNEPIGSAIEGDVSRWHHSFACLCPMCGTVWFRHWVEGTPWSVKPLPCLDHGVGLPLYMDELFNYHRSFHYRCYPQEVSLDLFLRRAEHTNLLPPADQTP